MQVRLKELRRRRHRRMKRLKNRLRDQMTQAGTIRAERAVEKQRRRMKRPTPAEQTPADQESS